MFPPPGLPQTFPTRSIAILALPGIEAVDVVGPFEIFSTANRLLAQLRPGAAPPYLLSVVAERRGVFPTAGGLSLSADRAMSDLLSGVDTLVVTGALDFDTREVSSDDLRWVVRQATHARRVVSICTGAFVLAQAGLLDGRRATTHWLKAETLAAHYPQVDVRSDAIFVRDGKVWTSAGATAGMDLALSLVADDLGREVARAVAQLLVMFVHRPGGQSQFSAALTQPPADDHRISEVQLFVLEHPDADLRVSQLAKRAGMSPRNFARVFKALTGGSVGSFVATVRLQAAKRMLEEPLLNLEEVAEHAGYGSAETMRRVFHRNVGANPSSYRERFCRQ